MSKPCRTKKVKYAKTIDDLKWGMPVRTGGVDMKLVSIKNESWLDGIPRPGYRFELVDPPYLILDEAHVQTMLKNQKVDT